MGTVTVDVGAAAGGIGDGEGLPRKRGRRDAGAPWMCSAPRPGPRPKLSRLTAGKSPSDDMGLISGPAG
jgi:hypothetical protein